MKKHLVGLAFLGLALGAQACNVTVDLPHTLPSLPVTIATGKPVATCDPAVLKANDSDGDGKINLSELNGLVNPPYAADCPACGARAQLDPSVPMKKYDKDGDGMLNSVEFCAYQLGSDPDPTPKPSTTPTVIVEPPPPSIFPTVQPTTAPPPSPSATPTATPSTVPAGSYTATPASFDELDKDKDGKVTWDEEIAFQTRNGALPPGAKDKIYDLYRQADTNQNGTLERGEYDFARS